ncbi:MAG TPA: T9SS type A sorting domain-containing protein, partial [Saprospiraceae bacterium]|nr:T9SS type A sorting domain-containing protein [Saprospiraceae bacterium]
TFLLFSFTVAKTTAQEFDCNLFCVTDIRMDTVLDDYMIVTIFFEGDSTDFINYPYVAVVLDQQGDTVGTSPIDLFDQIGNSSAEYHVQTVLDSIPSNFSAYIYFRFDTSTCVLTYPCTTSALIPTFDLLDFNIYPNPFSTETVIQFDKYRTDISANVFNSQGQLVRNIADINNDHLAFKKEHLAPGLYFLQFVEGDKVIAIEKILIR